MKKETILRGITTTGTPHLGNYVGAIRPAIEASRKTDNESFYFLANYHAIISCHEPSRISQSSREVAATWLALGLDTDNAFFYRQSDIPEIMELTWVLTCMTAKGLMNRAHAYKAAVAANEADNDKDPDKGITMGLYSYPVLMAADILMFKAHKIPVGKDQIQHVEMARDIAARFNHHFGELFVLPEALVSEDVAVLSGLDGRKMSKSYNNTIPLFTPEKQLRKLEDVYDIKELRAGHSVYRELILVKVRANASERMAINAIAEIFRASIVDVGKESVTVMLTGDQSKLDAMINLLEDYEILELARTGVTGLSRGTEDVRYLP